MAVAADSSARNFRIVFMPVCLREKYEVRFKVCPPKPDAQIDTVSFEADRTRQKAKLCLLGTQGRSCGKTPFGNQFTYDHPMIPPIGR
jgi:hypothetical protein